MLQHDQSQEKTESASSFLKKKNVFYPPPQFLHSPLILLRKFPWLRVRFKQDKAAVALSPQRPGTLQLCLFFPSFLSSLSLSHTFSNIPPIIPPQFSPIDCLSFLPPPPLSLHHPSSGCSFCFIRFKDVGK